LVDAADAQCSGHGSQPTVSNILIISIICVVVEIKPKRGVLNWLR
jgi:hypothetical protein